MEEIPNITMTPRAIEIAAKAASEEKTKYIRIGVKGGGCAGYEYFMDLANQSEIREMDIELVMSDNLTLLIDNISLQYLEGTEIGYQESLTSQGFIFNNPNAKRTCGCGNSFS